MTQANFQAWQAMSRNLHERVRRVESMMDHEIRETARRAGIDADIYPIHAHNAMCSFRDGKPWAGVDYSLVRRVLWLEQRMYEPARIADRVISRAWQRIA